MFNVSPRIAFIVLFIIANLVWIAALLLMEREHRWRRRMIQKIAGPDPFVIKVPGSSFRGTIMRRLICNVNLSKEEAKK